MAAASRRHSRSAGLGSEGGALFRSHSEQTTAPPYRSATLYDQPSTEAAGRSHDSFASGNRRTSGPDSPKGTAARARAAARLGVGAGGSADLQLDKPDPTNPSHQPAGAGSTAGGGGGGGGFLARLRRAMPGAGGTSGGRHRHVSRIEQWGQQDEGGTGSVEAPRRLGSSASSLTSGTPTSSTPESSDSGTSFFATAAGRRLGGSASGRVLKAPLDEDSDALAGSGPQGGRGRSSGGGGGTCDHWDEGGAAATAARSGSGGRSIPAGMELPAGESGGRARGLVGLHNQGNTCFLNSALQCCLNTPPLTAWLLTRAAGVRPNPRSATRGRMVMAAAALARRVWGKAGAGGAERPSDVKAVVGRVASRFLGYDQQDAQEFLRFFLDTLHEDVCRVHGKQPYRELSDPVRAPDEAVAEAWWAYDQARNDSAIRDIFAGQARSRVTCGDCGHVSRAFDTFWDIVVPIPHRAQIGAASGGRSRFGGAVGLGASCSVEDCLGAFTAAEDLSKVGYKCGKCKSCRCTKDTTLWRAPRALVLVLKRFTFSAFRRAKITASVRLATSGLDIAQFCATGGEQLRTNHNAWMPQVRSVRCMLHRGSWRRPFNALCCSTVYALCSPDALWYNTLYALCSQRLHGERRRPTTCGAS